MATRQTKSQEATGSSGSVAGLVELALDIFDPTPDGKKLENAAVVRAAEDCAQFAEMAFLEPVGNVFIAGGEDQVVLERHRIILVVREHRFTEVSGHVKAYCTTVLPGHPVRVTTRPTGFIA